MSRREVSPVVQVLGGKFKTYEVCDSKSVNPNLYTYCFEGTNFNIIVRLPGIDQPGSINLGRRKTLHMCHVCKINVLRKIYMFNNICTKIVP